jgi:outer membrane receptor for Fe3+-dicitrate
LSQPAVEPVSLDEVVIQATRTRIAAFDYPGSVSSVSMDALQTIGATHSSEALNRAPGAFLQRGSGQEVLVALRSPVLTGPGACGAFLLMEDGLPLRPVGSCSRSILSRPAALRSCAAQGSVRRGRMRYTAWSTCAVWR